MTTSHSNTSPHPDEQALLAQCEHEPIHIPGAVQPFGVLLTVDPAHLTLQNVSGNCAQLWGLGPAELLGQPLGRFMPAEDAAALLAYLDRPVLKEQSPLPVRLCFAAGQTASEWEVSAHRHHGVLFLELEAADGQATPDSRDFHLHIRDALAALQQAAGLQQMCESAVTQIRELTGFDRVMLYRFDDDWHGEVVAEARSETVDSYLGHHFPASDIPAQARAIFLQNWLRMIPDVQYRPSRIVPGLEPGTGQPLDLSKSTLRSVSPIHLEYLRNMGVQASLTISLIDDGRLWGLITCHHASALRVSSEVRLAAQMIGQIVSSQIRIKLAQDEFEHRNRLNQVRASLAARIQQQDDYIDGLLQAGPQLLELAEAQGAAIGHDGKWFLVGTTPQVEQIEQIADWLLQRGDASPLFHSFSLAQELPAAAAFQDTACGVLAISIAKVQRSFILWFRPETITTVTWAGPPEKAVVEENGRATLHPRASFASWREVVRGKARRWQQAEIDNAQALRIDVLAAALQSEFEKERQARRLAEQASREKDEMVMIVSHDLRTPLSIAAMSFEYLQRLAPANDASARQILERGTRATRTMGRLISDILDLAKIEAGTLDLRIEPENASALVREVVDFSQPLAAEKQVTLVARAAPGPCEILCEKHRIVQVLDNLIGNALKFTPAGGRITVSLDHCDREATFCVADTGRGIPAESLERIFDRYWQAEQTRRLGTGLGLSIAKGIVEKHGGRIWAESEPGQGARFYFTVPRAA